MLEAKAVHESAPVTDNLLSLLLPQIKPVVRWSCQHYHHSLDQSSIDDLAQEIALLLLKDNARNLHSFENRSAEKTWLRIVVLHYVGRYFKSQKPTESIEELPVNTLPFQLPSQDDELLFKERQQLVEEAQGKLTEREQDLWKQLRSGLRNEEIAEQMNIKPRSVQRRKHALLKKLRTIQWRPI